MELGLLELASIVAGAGSSSYKSSEALNTFLLL
jgi:hypothetical protein